MFEVNKRFSAKKAASLLRKHRSELRREHAKLRALSGRQSKDPKGAELSEQVARLETRYRDSQLDTILVCRNLALRVDVLNLGDCADIMIANSHLQSTCQEVAKTIQKLNPKLETRGG
jgi:head-tail adaptor